MKLHDDGTTQVYCCDVRYAMDIFDPLDIHVLLTDPPYASFKYLRETEESGELSMTAEGIWSNNVFGWIAEWWWPIRAHMQPDGVGWVFCNVHYLGFYIRWARYSRWPLRGIFACSPEEFLLSFGPQPLTPMQGDIVKQACRLNTYGNSKSVPMLQALLSISPPGLVIDPFAGTGTTLVAARNEGRQSCGCELKEEMAQRCVENVEATV